MRSRTAPAVLSASPSITGRITQCIGESLYSTACGGIQDLYCLFRTNVTADSGIVTGIPVNVTGEIPAS